MTLRLTPTVVICAIGAAVAGGLLALPPVDDAAPAPPVVAAAPAGDGSGAAPAVIQIADFSFNGSRTAAAGAVVQVTNADAAAHTLTATSGAFDTGVVDEGATASFTAPAEPGTYEFICEIHPTMTGSLVVD
jgi:plastocyanin